MWKVDQRVKAQKGSEAFWCTGTIRHIDDQRCYVIFDDGEDALEEAEKLQALELLAGDQVFARLPMDGEYKPAKVVAWDDEKVRVQWPNGEEDWTSFGMIRWQPQNSKPTTAGNAYSEGQAVFACWHDLFWYPGVLLKIDGEQHHVLFDDGSQFVATADSVRPLAVEAGDHVLCRWQGGPQYYPGEISNRQGDIIHIQYDDGDEETTSIRLLRLQRDEWLPPSEPVNLQVGDRILGCWFDANWYPGVVLSVEGKRLHVLFDDGDQAVLTPERVRVLDIDVGDRIWCRYKGGPAYFAGEVTKKQGEVIHVHYDDGNEEVTSIRLIRILSDSNADLGQRFG